jgi:hypothetical protein
MKGKETNATHSRFADIYAGWYKSLGETVRPHVRHSRVCAYLWFALVSRLQGYSWRRIINVLFF